MKKYIIFFCTAHFFALNAMKPSAKKEVLAELQALKQKIDNPKYYLSDRIGIYPRSRSPIAYINFIAYKLIFDAETAIDDIECAGKPLRQILEKEKDCDEVLQFMRAHRVR